MCLTSGVGLMVNWKSSKTMLRCLGREELFRWLPLQQVSSPFPLNHSYTLMKLVRIGILFRTHQKTPVPFFILLLARHLLGSAALRTFLLQTSLQELSWEDLCGPHIASLSMSAYGSVSQHIPVKLVKFSSFLLVVPLLYGVIFKFRKGHAETSAGDAAAHLKQPVQSWPMAQVVQSWQTICEDLSIFEDVKEAALKVLSSYQV